ncbi:MAG: hypothetical protein Q9M89_04975 [Persephonella sp.]|nr:hypothetical protein [Persephonella sp.]
MPVISNITGRPLTDAGEIRKELKEPALLLTCQMGPVCPGLYGQ